MSAAKTYLVKTGLDYEVDGEPVRREPGDLVDDLPAKSIDWLLKREHIVVPPKKKPAKKAVS